MKVQGLLGEYELIEANKTQVGGDHYLKYGALQPWDVWLPWNLNGFQAAIIKYVVRYRDKEGLKDLEKARHFLTKLIELETHRYANENSKRSSNREE
jgi:hypothetical protein